MWVGTFDGGLTRLDRDGRVLETFRHDARRRRLRSAATTCARFSKTRPGHLWVGTAEGLDLLDRATGEFSHYRTMPATQTRCAIRS